MWGGSRHWERFVDFFPDRDILAPELPGFGLSGNPAQDYSPSFFRESLLAFLDEQNVGLFSVVGNSLGGRLAVALAEAAPGRVAAAVLISPAGLTPPATWLKALPKFRMPYEDGPDNVSPQAFRDLALAQMFSRPLDDPRIAPLARAERESHRGVSIGMFLTASARCLTEMSRDVPDEGRLRAVTCVRGLIWGRHDRLILPEVGEALQRIWPAARYEVLEDSGHVPHLETPEVCAAAVRRCLGPEH
jgi:3-oxoadipate enol-lactonase/4-carboxymuconolactone decarboxylase